MSATDLVIFVPEKPQEYKTCFRISEEEGRYSIEKFEETLSDGEVSLCKYGYWNLYEAVEACAHMMKLYPEIKYTTRITYLME